MTATEGTQHPAALVAGYDATFWHESYNLLRDAITDNLDAFIREDDAAEEAILVDAVERAAAHIAQATGAPTASMKWALQMLEDNGGTLEAWLIEYGDRVSARAPTPPTPSGDFGSLLSALLHDALTPEQFDAAHAAVLAEYERVNHEANVLGDAAKILGRQLRDSDTKVATLEARIDMLTAVSHYSDDEPACLCSYCERYRAALTPTGEASNGN